MAKVFKVAYRRHEGDCPCSALKDTLPWGLIIDYPEGMPVKPKYGMVFAFDNLEAARQFCNSRGCNCRIFEAQAGKTYPPSTKIPYVSSGGGPDRLINFWKGMFHLADSTAPAGTVLCDYLILGKEVA